MQASLHGHVLLLGENSIVGFQVVFLEVLGTFGRSDLDIELQCQFDCARDIVRLTHKRITNGEDQWAGHDDITVYVE
jgi:hypothetical protein